MIKLICLLWKTKAQAESDLRDLLTRQLAPELLALKPVSMIRIQLVDDAVAPAYPKRIASHGTLPDAVVSVYIESSDAPVQDKEQCIELVLARHIPRTECYYVEETEPLANLGHPAVSGERVYGYSQVVFLQRPGRLSESEWLELWQGQHTQIAIDTQASFAYRQNRILQALNPGAKVIHAIVEESFPPEAMRSELAFYGANTDSELRARMSAMMESCARFIDFDKIDVIPMSEYVFLP